MSRSTRIGLLAMMVITALPATASLIGDTVGGSVSSTVGPYSGDFDNSTAVVSGAAEEFRGTLRQIGESTLEAFADFTGNTVTIGIDFPGGGLWWGDNIPFLFEFSGLDWLPDSGTITGLSLLSSSPVGDTTAGPQSRWGTNPSTWITSFTADSISITTFDEWRVVSANGPLFATFAILTEHDDPVPEPATMTLLGMGLVGLVAKRRRKA